MQKKYAALVLGAFLAVSPNLAKAEGKDGVAALVNGDKITVAEMRTGYNDNPQFKGKVSFDDFYKKALDVYVNGKILYQAAEAEKITQSPEYMRQLAVAKEEIARKVYLEKKVKAKVTDASVKKLYEEYKANFKGGKEVKAKHILVDSDAKAKAIIEKLNQGGNFDALAKANSKEPAELGYFTKDMMVPEFGNAAFAMQKGTYSKAPVKTKFGYHVIMVEDIRDAKPLDFKTIEPQLKGMVTQQAIGEIFGNLVRNSKVERYDLSGKLIPNPPSVVPMGTSVK